MNIQFKSIFVGVFVGVATAFLLAIIPTVIDWYNNPGGIIHGQTGTNWLFVIETWFSWFWPVAIITTLIAVVTLAISRK